MSIDAATNSVLLLTNLADSDAGAYSVIVFNSFGATNSLDATLTIVAGIPELITFDDLPSSILAVPQGYNNLSWSNFSIDAIDYPESGYYMGMTSFPNVAYNNNGLPATISSSSHAI